MDKHHFLLLCYTVQGHVNPILHLANLLLRAAARVTLAVSVYGLRRISTLPTLPGLHFVSFSDGDDDGTDRNHTMDDRKRVGSQSLSNLLLSLSDERGPVTFLIYGILLPWAAAVARDLGIPSAYLSPQSATVFTLYHRLFKAGDGLFNSGVVDFANISMELPGVPQLKCEDLPSFLLPDSPHASIIPTIEHHIQTLQQDPKPCVLINTFDALEEDVIKALGDHMDAVSIGPLMQLNSFFSWDLFERSEDYLPWLNSKSDCSVIYVSFGSLATVQRSQTEEILHGLMDSGRPFLWVIRSMEKEVQEMIKNRLSEEQGLTVHWCSQVEVLSHRAVGCFLTHCGWNSTMESLVAGVPVVAYPQFSDQTTNAKLVDEVWKTGVKARAKEDGVVGREEIRRCLEMVMGSGEKGEETRRNAQKWKVLAAESMEERGSSRNNLRHFMERLEIRNY